MANSDCPLSFLFVQNLLSPKLDILYCEQKKPMNDGQMSAAISGCLIMITHSGIDDLLVVLLVCASVPPLHLSIVPT